MTYQDAMKATTRQLNIRGTVTLADTTVITLTNAHIMAYDVNEGGNFIPLGTAASASYTLELANSAGEWFKGGSIIGVKVLQGAAVHTEIGVKVYSGGTNLMLGSGTFEGWTDVGFSKVGNEYIATFDGADNFCMNEQTPSVEGRIYTVSFKAKTIGQSNVTIGLAVNGTYQNKIITNTYATYSMSFVWGTGYTTVILGTNVQTIADTTLYVKEIKVELGSVATDWSPSPEDLPDGVYSYADAGTWYVNKSSGKEGGRFVLSGNDKLMTSYEAKYADTLEYTGSTDLQDVFDHIQTKGVTISGTLACNAAAIIAVKPDWGENCTIRSALSYVAMAGGCFVRVNRAGALELVTLNNVAAAKAISTAGYIELDNQNTYFAFNRVKVMPRGAKADTVYTEGVVNGGLPEAANNTITINDNPIFALSAVNLQTMANALATALTGYELELMTFRWRGDPTFVIGDNVALTDRRAEVTTTQIIQQQMRYELGLMSDITCQLNLETMLPSAISPNGTISPIAFGLGSLDPSVLIAKSITAAQIAADTITAGEIAALTITAAEIAAETITAAKMVTGTITAESGIIADLAVTSAKIATAGIEFAKIKDLVTGVGIFSTGAGDELYINRLYVVAANIANLTVGELVFKDSNGDLYRLGVDINGDVETTLVEVLYQNISDTALLSISEYVVYKGASAPATPFIGQLWIDTDTDITSRCTAITPAAVWVAVKASELHTSYISAVATGLEILSTGKIDILSGGNLNVLSGGDIVIASGGHLNLTAPDGIYIGTAPMQVGGTNLIKNSDMSHGLTYWASDGYSSLGVAPDDPFGTNDIYGSGGTGTVYIRNSSISGYPFVVGEKYTLSFWSEYALCTGVQIVDVGGANSVFASAVTSTGIHIGNWYYYNVPITISGAPGTPWLMLIHTLDFSRTALVKLEKGNIATDWSPAPSDPSSGVKTSYITIDSDSIDIASGGSINVAAGGAFNVTAADITLDSDSDLVFNDMTIRSTTVTNSYGWIILGTEDILNVSAMAMLITLCAYPDTSARTERYRFEYGNFTAQGDVGVQGAIHIVGSCTASSFVDDTPSYVGDALADLSTVKDDGKGKIDHASLPKAAQTKIKRIEKVDDKDIEIEKPGRDLGMMISILTKAVQQLTEIVTDQQKQIDKLGAKK